MLVVQQLHVGYGGVEVLHGMDLEIQRGAILALLGPNGAGKTTLARTIAGLVRPVSGRVILDSIDMTRIPAHRRIRHGLVLVPEDKGLFPQLSVTDNLALGCFVRNRHRKHSQFERIFDLFPALATRADQAAGDLSGGQQQMLAIGRALMAEPDFLVLDEPSLGLSPLIIQVIFETIRELATAGMGVLLVEQNAKRALAIADRATVLDRGRVAMSGSAAEVQEDPRVEASYLGSAV